MLLNDRFVPITQTTGMFFRNCIFINGIPEIMEKAVGTRSERSFEGDTGRFMMHLKEGPAYYDSKCVGVYRLTGSGIWNSLSPASKKLISARMQLDYQQYYGVNPAFFVNRAFRLLRAYLEEKQKELLHPDSHRRRGCDDVYSFCRQYESEISVEKYGIKEKLRKIVRIIRE